VELVTCSIVYSSKGRRIMPTGTHDLNHRAATSLVVVLERAARAASVLSQSLARCPDWVVRRGVDVLGWAFIVACYWTVWRGLP
jgi:hypothetical protein